MEAALFQQIDQIKSEGVTEEEVAKAKRQLEVDLVMSLTTSHALASRVGQDTVFFGRVRTIDERLASIQAVTADDVKRVMEKYLESEGSSVVQVLDSGSPPPAIEPGEGSS